MRNNIRVACIFKHLVFCGTTLDKRQHLVLYVK